MHVTLLGRTDRTGTVAVYGRSLGGHPLKEGGPALSSGGHPFKEGGARPVLQDKTRLPLSRLSPSSALASPHSGAYFYAARNSEINAHLVTV